MVKFNYKRALEHTTKAESCMDSDHTPQADTERNTTNLNSTSFPKRFVDLLDLQLLLAVIVFFVSGWAYLNSIICGFTGSESINEQMSYILVHYVMSATLCLCLYITYIKGKHVLKLKSDILPNKIYYFHFFLDSWLGILILCLLVIMSSGIGCPWWIWAIILIAALVWKLRRLKFGWMKTLAFTTWVIAMFPVFISTMTLIVKDIEIMTDKHLYSPSDNIYISANGKGYACHHELVGLGNEYLYHHAVMDNDYKMIVLPTSEMQGNTASIGTVGPANGKEFLLYPFREIMGMPPHYLSEKPQYIYYTPLTINIKTYE